MKHIIQLWPGDWAKQMAKMNEAVGMKNFSRWMGEGNGWFVLSEGKSSGNVLVAFYQQFPMGRKGTSFGVKNQKLFVG